MSSTINDLYMCLILTIIHHCIICSAPMPFILTVPGLPNSVTQTDSRVLSHTVVTFWIAFLSAGLRCFPLCLSASGHKLKSCCAHNLTAGWLVSGIFCPDSRQPNTLHCQPATLCLQHWPQYCCSELESISSLCARNVQDCVMLVQQYFIVFRCALWLPWHDDSWTSHAVQRDSWRLAVKQIVDCYWSSLIWVQ